MKVGDLVRVISCGSYCEITEIHKEEAHAFGSGHCWVEFIADDRVGTFTLDEVELIDESR